MNCIASVRDASCGMAVHATANTEVLLQEFLRLLSFSLFIAVTTQDILFGTSAAAVYRAHFLGQSRRMRFRLRISWRAFSERATH